MCSAAASVRAEEESRRALLSEPLHDLYSVRRHRDQVWEASRMDAAALPNSASVRPSLPSQCALLQPSVGETISAPR